MPNRENSSEKRNRKGKGGERKEKAEAEPLLPVRWRLLIEILDRYEPFGDGKTGQTGDAVDVQLAHDALAMCFDGANTKIKLHGDFLVAQAFGDEHQHFALAIGQIHWARPLARAAHKLSQCNAGNIRAEIGLAAMHGLNRLKQLFQR